MRDLQRLSYFVAIVDAGTVSLAASRLRVSQPALSRQLATLERQVGTALFEREGRGLSLTAAGAVFAEEARALLKHAERVESAARDLQSGRPSALVIAAPHSTITEVVAPFLATLTADNPLLTARVASSLTPAAESLKAADLVLSAGPPTRGLRTVTLGRAPVCAQVRGDHPWALDQRTTVDVAELSGQDLVIQTGDNSSRQVLDTVLAQRGIATNTVTSSELELVVQALAAAGRGIGVLTEHPRFGLHTIQLTDHDRPLEVVMHASWLPDHYASGEIGRIVGLLTEHMDAVVRRYY